MENLNAEQVKKGLERCANEWHCGLCGFTEKECALIKKSALALITSQEQRIEELAAENVYGLPAKELAEKCENLSIELEAMRGAANSYKMHNKKLTEENERLRAENKALVNENAELKNQVQEEGFTEEDIDFIEEYTKLLNEGIREATICRVQKFAKMMKEEFSDTSIHGQSEIYLVIDHCTNEVLGDNK